MDRNNPSYDDICRFVGQLFIESRHHLEQLTRNAQSTIDNLRSRVGQLEKERDGALSLLREKNGGSTP